VPQSYFIDGREARGSDYTGAIDALPEDDLALTCVRAPGKSDVAISTDPGGVVVIETRADGSSWMSEPITRDHAKSMVGSFLNGDEEWRRGVDWEQTVLTSREGRRRTFRILLIGAVLVALVAWLVKALTE
jgi:hypothetical protein